MWLTTKKFKSSGKIGISAFSEQHLYEDFSNNFPLRYDLGKMPLYCYRVSGRGTLPEMFKPPVGFNNQIVYSQIYNIFARSITEIPEKLREGNFKGYVYKVYKYEKAIYNKDFLNDIASGVVDPNNYGFINVTKEFCKLPDAGEFCTEFYEVTAKASFTTDYARVFEGSGSLKIRVKSKISNSSYFKYKVKRKIKNRINFMGSATVIGVNLLPTLTYQGSGNLKIKAKAKKQNNYLGYFTFNAVGNLEIINSNNYNYNPAENVFDPISGSNIPVTACGCPANTNLIYFSTNLFKRNSILDKFLYRNNLSSQELIKLFYDTKAKTYFNSLKLEGLSLIEGKKEIWNISTSLGCTNQVDFNQKSLWQFSCSITRKIFNKNKIDSLESKVSIFLPYNLICTSIDALEFYYRVNLKEMVVYNKFKDKITNIPISIYKDNIKLFTSGNWLVDPFFNVFIYSKPILLEQYYRPMVALPQTDIRNAITGRQEITQS